MGSLVNILSLVAIALISFTSAIDWKAKFSVQCPRNPSGPPSLSVHINGTSPTTCVRFTNLKLCNGASDLRCFKARYTNAIVPEVGCVRLYNGVECSGTPMMELRQGTMCHSQWEDCGIYRKVKSVGGCPPNSSPTDSSGFNQRTTGISTAGTSSLMNGTVTSTNFPNRYNDNENKNWIITVPYGKKIKMRIDSLTTESCVDRLHIRELVSNEEIFMACSGPHIPSFLVSKSNQVRLNFRSDGSRTHSGFRLHWESTL